MLSELMDADDPELKFWPGAFDGTRAYAQNKRVQVYMTAYWAKFYRDSGVSFYSMHPGWVDTPAVR